jgi:hypothetical protein
MRTARGRRQVAALPRPPPQPLCGDSVVGREEAPAALGNGEGRDGVRRKQKRCPLTSPSSVSIGTYTWRRRPALLCIKVEKKFSLNPMRSISGASVRLPCNRKGPAPLRSGLVAPTRHREIRQRRTYGQLYLYQIRVQQPRLDICSPSSIGRVRAWKYR